MTQLLFKTKQSVATAPSVLAVLSLLTAVSTVTVLSTPLFAQGVQTVSEDIRYLSDDAREGRGVGTEGLNQAAQYIANSFEAAGLQPFDGSSFLQEFDLDPSAPAVAHSGIGAAHVANVVGILPGSGPMSDETVVIGAHYDHLGYGGSGSLDPDSTGVVHNGADDNASGTVALMEAARMLAARSAAGRRTLVFVAFTGEELGLLGSDYYVKHPATPNENTYAMINMDMVGRLREGRLITIGTGSADEWGNLLEDANSDFGLTLNPLDDPWGRSDHSSFYAAHIPVVHLFTDNHEDYHRTTDDWPLINNEGIETVAGFAAELAWNLATREGDLTFRDVPQPRASTGGGYGAYLGSIPDMSGTPGGVRLTGVREGSPAQQAGIQAGDIIVQIGEDEIADLFAMTDALRKHHPGDTVTIAVMRNDERVELTVTFGRRGG